MKLEWNSGGGQKRNYSVGNGDGFIETHYMLIRIMKYLNKEWEIIHLFHLK